MRRPTSWSRSHGATRAGSRSSAATRQAASEPGSRTSPLGVDRGCGGRDRARRERRLGRHRRVRPGPRLGGGGAVSGETPTSIAVHGSLVYVLNAGTPANVAGFRLDGGRLEPIAGSERALSRPDADPAQVAFSPDGGSLVVTERATDSITTFAVGPDGLLGAPVSRPSAGRTPYGFDFTPDGTLVVTEAVGGEIGAASASTYTVTPTGVEAISRTIGDTRSEVCWAAVTKDGRHALR